MFDGLKGGVCLVPCGVRIEVRFVPKCRESLVGCAGGEVGVDQSFSVPSQASGEVGVSSYKVVYECLGESSALAGASCVMS